MNYNHKIKKRRRVFPLGISEHDGKILTKVKQQAYHLDMSLFNCCGIRFGWSSVIGIIPGYAKGNFQVATLTPWVVLATLLML
jgi:hypothetical protein